MALNSRVQGRLIPMECQHKFSYIYALNLVLNFLAFLALSFREIVLTNNTERDIAHHFMLILMPICEYS